MRSSFSYPPPLANGRPKILRTRPQKHKEAIAPYALKIGTVLWEWNALQAQFFHIFWAVLGDPRTQALGLWHSAQNDDLQRKMLGAVMSDASTRTKDKWEKRIFQSLLWSIERANEFSAYRNILAHLPMVLSEDKNGNLSVSSDILTSRRAAGIRHVLVTFNHEDFWSKLASDLFALGQYVVVLGFGLYYADSAGRPPSLRKPRLLSLPILRETNRLVNDLTAKPKRRRPRRASRA